MDQKENLELNNNITSKTDVLLLSAGLGKRLRPLTDKMPKPLVPLCNKPLIDWNLSLISKAGFKRVFVNLFYKSEMIKDYVADGKKWNLEIIYSEEKELLDTGGAIKKIKPQLKGKFLLMLNSDTILDPNFDLKEPIKTHLNTANSPLATLLLKKYPKPEEFGTIVTDTNRRIVKFLDAPLNGKHENYSDNLHYNHLIYLGVSVLSKELILSLPQDREIFSITRDVYRTLILEGKNLSSFLYNAYWSDVGTPERLEQASKDCQELLR